MASHQSMNKLPMLSQSKGFIAPELIARNRPAAIPALKKLDHEADTDSKVLGCRPPGHPSFNRSDNSFAKIL